MKWTVHRACFASHSLTLRVFACGLVIADQMQRLLTAGEAANQTQSATSRPLWDGFPSA